MKSLMGKVVAITGAGSGIGRMTAIAAANKGANLAISDVNEEGLNETKAILKHYHVDVTYTQLDVSDREAVYQWAKDTYEHFGKVNVIINNAGVALGGVANDLEYKDFEWIMNINFWGVVYGTKAFLPYLVESGEGHVVNISSLFGLIAMPASSAYNASKFAVRGFTEALSTELQIENAPVNVTSVHPGGIDTNIARSGRVVPNKQWGLVDNVKSGKEFESLARTKPEDAANQILDAILNERRRLLIGNDAKLFDLVQRVVPSLYQNVVASFSRRQQLKNA